MPLPSFYDMKLDKITLKHKEVTIVISKLTVQKESCVNLFNLFSSHYYVQIFTVYNVIRILTFLMRKQNYFPTGFLHIKILNK